MDELAKTSERIADKSFNQSFYRKVGNSAFRACKQGTRVRLAHLFRHDETTRDLMPFKIKFLNL